MKKIKTDKTRYTTRTIALKFGWIGESFRAKNGDYYCWRTIPVNKHGSKKKKKIPPKFIPYASWHKIFGYKDLDELYQIIGHGKYRKQDL